MKKKPRLQAEMDVEMNQFKVIVSEPYHMIREALAEMIKKQIKDVMIIGQTVDATECIKLLKEQEADLIITEVYCENNGANRIIDYITEKKRKEKLLLLSNIVDSKFVELMRRKGCLTGYIWKGSNFKTLEEGICSVLCGKKYMDEEVIRILEEKEKACKAKLKENKQDISLNAPLVEYGDLSKREIEVLKLLTNGKLNKEIAYELSISEKTVKNHISNIFKKISVGDRTQAAVYAIKNNIVSL